MGAALPRPIERSVALPGGISGTLVSPSANGPLPCVVLVHGLGGNRDETGGLFATLAARLAERGIASLRFDFPGCGRSAGDFADATLGLYASVAAAALRYAAGLDSQGRSALGLLGYSFGAAVAAAVLAEEPRLASLVLWAPVIDPERDMLAILGAARAADAERNGAVCVPWGEREIRLKRGFFRSLTATIPLDKIAAFEGALLVIAGERDFLAKNVGPIEAAARRTRAREARVLPDTDHVFGALRPDGGCSDSVTRATADFFAATLEAR